MIHGTPKVVRLAINLHENLIQVPLPVRMGALLLDALSADLGGEQRAEPIPPKPNCLVATASLSTRAFDWLDFAGSRLQTSGQSVPPEPNRFVADVDPAFVRQILDTLKRKRTYIITARRMMSGLVLK